jgi:hypothetical protein
MAIKIIVTVAGKKSSSLCSLGIPMTIERTKEGKKRQDIGGTTLCIKAMVEDTGRAD